MLEVDSIKTTIDQEQSHEVLFFDQEQLFAGVRPRLLRLARMRGVAPDMLEDVVQETLLVAWRRLDRLQSPEHFHRWVDEICRNICQRFQRASYRDASRLIPFFASQSADELDEFEEALRASDSISESLDPAEVLSRHDLTVLLEQALGALPEHAREALELYYLRELPQREAALRLGLSISAMETRLHRARRQLLQILHGDLRDEALSLGLPLDEEPAMGWRETRRWCYYCGRRRLHGIFETASDGHLFLRMRCPDCSRRLGFDIVNGKSVVQLDGLHSFQPAFKRTMQGLSRHLMQAITTGEAPCVRCGKAVPIGIVNASGQDVPGSGLRHFWVIGLCRHCGYKAGGFSADDALYWSDPVIQQFMQRYPHWLNEPDAPVEYDGQPAILFRLADGVGAARLHVITQRQTLRVLATFQE